MTSHDKTLGVSELKSRAGERFPSLTAAEVKLLQASPRGDLAYSGSSSNISDPSNDPRTGHLWDTERHVRAELIRWLCVDQPAKQRLDPQGIRLVGAKILGELNLSNVTVPFPITLAHCFLDSEINLTCANLLEINLQGTRTRSIKADGVTVKNSVLLRRGFHAWGQVRFAIARIGGNLDCEHATFENPATSSAADGGTALVADGATVNGAVFLRNGFMAVGEVRLIGTQIGGYLDCSTATFKNPHQGTVNLAALSADGIVVKGSALFHPGFHAAGEVRLLGARIEGNLDFSGATILNPFLSAPSTTAASLTADRASVGGGVFLRDGFRAEGEVRLLGAEIVGDLDCGGGIFLAAPPSQPITSNRALSAHTVTVNGNVFLRTDFHAEGEVGFSGAHVAGNFECTGGTFHGELYLEMASIRGGMYWKSIKDPEQAKLNLMCASVGTLDDDSKSWPGPSRLATDGLVYERFSAGAPKDAAIRLDWLSRNEFFSLQPYRQLAKSLRIEGDETGALQVLYEMEHRRRLREDRSWHQRLWSWALRNTVGYGYYPGRSLRCLLGLIILGSALSWGGYAIGSITPTDKDAYTTFKHASQLPPHYEGFQPFVYALENSFPPLKLGQADRWQPDPDPSWQCKPSRWSPQWGCRPFSPACLRWFRRLQTCLGWFLATMGLAAVTGFIRKE